MTTIIRVVIFMPIIFVGLVILYLAEKISGEPLFGEYDEQS